MATRNYKKEYKKFQSSPEQKKKRAARNKARRKLGLKKGDPRDASHTKNGVVAKHKSKNRGSKCDMPGDKKARGKGSTKKQPARRRTTKKK
jgi:hypothetical protein